jgi:hypothetical protein
MLAKVAPAPIYALDELATAQGHEILRTPPSHPELQPIETCWAVVKNQMARKSKFTMAHLLEQLDDAFASVTEETCSGLIKKVRQVEDKYLNVARKNHQSHCEPHKIRLTRYQVPARACRSSSL